MNVTFQKQLIPDQSLSKRRVICRWAPEIERLDDVWFERDQLAE